MPASLERPDPLVQLRRATVDVPGRPGLLNNVDLSIRRGDRIVVVGPSGSGKSTLLAIVGKLLEPTAGEVRHVGIHGATGLSWIFQQTYVLGHRTVIENIALAGLAIGMEWSDAVARASGTVESVGLTERAHTPASRISAGEKQRVGVARAILGNPTLVLADEPTASLDGDLVCLVADLLVNSMPSTAAVLIASHDQRVAAACSTVMDLTGGRLVLR